MPVTWLQRVAADHLVDHGVLQRVSVKESLRSPYPALNNSYQVTEAGRSFLSSVEDCLLPQDVLLWYRGGVSLLGLLEDHVAELKEGEGGSVTSDLLLEYLGAMLKEGRDLLVRRSTHTRLPPEAAPTTISQP
jgi:hypothetical protein